MSDSHGPPGHYDDVDAVLDLPTAFYVEEWLRLYPNATFILTTRDQNDWFDAMHAHVASMLDAQGGMPIRIRRL